jgi:hypothetical protein
MESLEKQMKQNEMLLQESLKDRSLLRNTRSGTDDHHHQLRSPQQRSRPSSEMEAEEDVRQTFQRATKPKEGRPQSRNRTKKIAKTSQQNLRPKSSPTQRLSQTQTAPQERQQRLRQQQQQQRDDERSEWVGAVLDGGDMMDIVQLLETIDPMILQVTLLPSSPHPLHPTGPLSFSPLSSLGFNLSLNVAGNQSRSLSSVRWFPHDLVWSHWLRGL